jgi:hypothetical protein
LERPFDKHISNEELEALVALSADTGEKPHGISLDSVREAERHVESCEDCSGKVSKYRQLVSRSSTVMVSALAPRGADCPNDEDVDWPEVAAGLWPELKAKQLIVHAAFCDHCGPLLRAATSVDDDPTPQEEKLLAELKAPSRPVLAPKPVPIPPSRRWFIRWVPALAVTAISFVGLMIPWSSLNLMPGAKFATFAVNTYKQQAQGILVPDFFSDSQQKLNEWLKAKSPFSLVLPASPPAPGEERPYQLECAGLVQLGGKTAVYIAYPMETGPVSLIVAPDSVAVASGGIKVDFKKVSFHYRTVEGYKVVTWSLHGLTYALVSQEGNSSQKSCMVCHFPMRDRDLTRTPTPLRTEPALQ